MDKLEHNTAALKRWRTRLKRAMTAIDKLEKQRKRLEAAKAKPAVQKVAPVKPEPLAVTIIKEIAAKPDDLGIPTFLKADRAADEAAANEIREEQAERKKAKSRGRVEKMKAKARGDLKRMPLTGKAALAAIRGG